MEEENEGFIEDDSIVLEDSDNSDIEDVNTSKIIPFIIYLIGNRKLREIFFFWNPEVVIIIKHELVSH